MPQPPCSHDASAIFTLTLPPLFVALPVSMLRALCEARYYMSPLLRCRCRLMLLLMRYEHADTPYFAAYASQRRWLRYAPLSAAAMLLRQVPFFAPLPAAFRLILRCRGDADAAADCAMMLPLLMLLTQMMHITMPLSPLIRRLLIGAYVIMPIFTSLMMIYFEITPLRVTPLIYAMHFVYAAATPLAIAIYADYIIFTDLRLMPLMPPEIMFFSLRLLTLI